MNKILRLLAHLRWFRKLRGGVWLHTPAVHVQDERWVRFSYVPLAFSAIHGDEDWRRNHDTEFNPHDYTYVFSKETVGQESMWVARIAEVTDALGVGSCIASAYDEAIDVLLSLRKNALKCNLAFPKPLAKTERHLQC